MQYIQNAIDMISIPVSIGVAMAVRSLDLTADEILRHADTAMYRAKDAGRNCIAFFDDSMVEKARAKAVAVSPTPAAPAPAPAP